jgi:hypothetical protein
MDSATDKNIGILNTLSIVLEASQKPLDIF